MIEKLKSFRWKTAAIGLVIVLILAVCFWQLPKPCVIRLGVFAGSSWNVPDATVYDILDSAVSRYEKEHPTVDVVYDSGIRIEDYSEWLSSRIVEGDMPDVFMVLNEDFASFASIGALKNLDGLMNSSQGIESSIFYESALQTGQWNGQIYGLPYQSNPQFMFVNLSLLEKEGIEVPDEHWTLQDLESICRQVTRDLDGDGLPDQFGIYNYTWRNALQAADADPFIDGGSQANLLDPTVQKAVSFAFSLDELSKGHEIEQSDFDEGRVAFSPMSYAEYKTYKPYPWKVKKFSEFDWTIIPMPTLTGQESGTVMDSLLISMSSTTPHTEQAWSFMKMLTENQQTQRILFRLSSGLPSTRLSWNRAGELSSVQSHELNLEVTEQVMERSRVIPRFPGYEQYLSQLDARLRSGFAQADDHDIYFMDLQNEMNRILQSAGSV